MVLASSLLLIAGCIGATKAASPDEWRSRSIYQVLTDRFARADGSTTAPCNTEERKYCGGSYKGLTSQLDYIQGMGFDSIWISPITTQIENDPTGGSAYHAYWQTDLYGLNENFGTAEDFKAFIDELHSRDMYLMVDVVTNHFGWGGDSGSIDYSKLKPFDNADYFNDPCSIDDYENQDMVEDCWLSVDAVALPDLKTTDERVINIYNDWISGLVSNYSVDGLRIDTVKHVEKEFWPGFMEAAGVYAVGEVFQGDPAYTCAYQEYVPGVLNFPVFYPLLEAFKSSQGSLSSLAQGIQTTSEACSDVGLLGTFSENHDIPRFASFTKDMSLAKNLVTFTIMFDGIPIVYAGQEQHYAGGEDPANREALWLSEFNTDAPLYVQLASLNKARSHVASKDTEYIKSTSSVKYSDDSTLALVKGRVTTALTNVGASGEEKTITVENTGYEAGQQVIDVLSCEAAEVTDGGLQVVFKEGLPKVFLPSDLLEGSGLCEGKN